MFRRPKNMSRGIFPKLQTKIIKIQIKTSTGNCHICFIQGLPALPPSSARVLLRHHPKNRDMAMNQGHLLWSSQVLLQWCNERSQASTVTSVAPNPHPTFLHPPSSSSLLLLLLFSRFPTEVLHSKHQKTTRKICWVQMWQRDLRRNPMG